MDTEFDTVIVFVRPSAGGFMFVHKNNSIHQLDVKERMLIEVSYKLCGLLNDNKIDMEVHEDINTNPQFKNNEPLRDVTGYFLGMGFAFKAKPEAFASSCCVKKIVN